MAGVECATNITFSNSDVACMSAERQLKLDLSGKRLEPSLGKSRCRVSYLGDALGAHYIENIVTNTNVVAIEHAV